MLVPTCSSVRLDKWLWAVRIYKTRALAADACRQGKVKIGEQAAKASREVKTGDVIELCLPDLTRTVRVLGSLRNRVAAKFVADFAEDITPATEYLRQIESRRNVPRRPAGTGRPTKKDRRDLEAFSEQNPEG